MFMMMMVVVGGGEINWLKSPFRHSLNLYARQPILIVCLSVCLYLWTGSPKRQWTDFH